MTSSESEFLTTALALAAAPHTKAKNQKAHQDLIACVMETSKI